VKSRQITMVLAALLSLTTAWHLEGQIRRNVHAIKDEYIVVLNDDTPQASVPGIVHQLTQQHGGSAERIWQYALKGYFARMNEGQALGLSHNSKVKYVEENAEMFSSTRVSTRVDPACDPPANCSTTDNRLWHLDSIDQNGPAPSGDYAYCNDGAGVYVYVVDSGVQRAHREFNNDAARVVNGYNAGDDGAFYPAYDPCAGRLGAIDHGTGVGSMVAGRNVGVARGATIVPVKVANCGDAVKRTLARNTAYPVGEIVSLNATSYICRIAGTTADTPAFPPANNSFCAAGGGLQDGTACFDYRGAPPPQTVQMVIEGVDWILRPANPNPKAHQVATFSTYRVARGLADAAAQQTVAGRLISFDEAVLNLIAAGVTVVASANNQNGNACDTSPAHLSRNSPDRPAPSAPNWSSYKVITVGGTMLVNNPDGPSSANGGSLNRLEPAFDNTRSVREARWLCTAGDSDVCSADGAANPPPTGDPAFSFYTSLTYGSNAGQCVTLFAPAKNIPVAALNTSGYRDPRADGGFASGTSWSAPIVAGVIARILSAHPTYAVDDVHDELMAHYTSSDLLDTAPYLLNSPGSSNTPNAVLHFPDVTIAALPATSTGALTASAAGTAPLTYQWYQVNAGFDVNTYHSDAAASSTAIAGANTATLSSPTAGTSYFVRVISSCGSADSNITTSAAPALQVPLNVTARTQDANSRIVHVTWSLVSGATSYRIERATCMGAACWGQAAVSNSATVTSYDDTPPLVTGQPVTTYLYRVVALAGSSSSLPSAIDFATTATTLFAEPIAGNGTTVAYGSHIKELRNAIDAVRVAAGLSISGQGWIGWPSTYASPTGLIYGADVGAMRRALDQAISTLKPGAHFAPVSDPSGLIVNGDFNNLRETVR
jgi:hypothetical protein